MELYLSFCMYVQVNIRGTSVGIWDHEHIPNRVGEPNLWYIRGVPRIRHTVSSPILKFLRKVFPCFFGSSWAHFPHFTGVYLLEERSEHMICLYYLKAQQSVEGNMVDL